MNLMVVRAVVRRPSVAGVATVAGAKGTMVALSENGTTAQLVN
jgi:hypothetical protein